MRIDLADIAVAAHDKHKEESRSQVEITLHGKAKTFTRKSFGFLGIQNKLRYACVWLHEWKYFDIFILLLIAINSLFLIMYDFSFRTTGEKTWRNSLVEESDLIFLILFSIEALIKIIGMGFWTDKWTYIRDPWNILDFIVVVSGWINVIPGSANLSAFRALRILRPLRSIRALKAMKSLILSILRSLPGLFNVALLLVFMILIFAIIGVNSLRGTQYQRCRYTPEPVDGQIWKADPDISNLWTLDNAGGLEEWGDDRYCGKPGEYFLFDYTYKKETETEELDYGIANFNDLGSALITIFQIFTLEGWTKLMYVYYDAQNPVFISIFFLLTIVMGSFFLMNIMLGAIYYSFSIVKDQVTKEGDEKKARFTPQLKKQATKVAPKIQKQKTKMLVKSKTTLSKQGTPSTTQRGTDKMSARKSQTIVVEVVKDINTMFQTPKQDQLGSVVFKSSYEQSLRNFVSSKAFQLFIIVCIVLNIGFLAMDRHPIDDESLLMMEVANFIFYLIFAIELILKVLAYGLKEYCADRFNIFDAFIILIVTIELIVNVHADGASGNSGMFTALRAFRLLRLFKLIKSWKGLQRIINVMFDIFSNIQYAYFAILILMFLTIFSLFGMEFFAERFKFDDDHMVDRDGQSSRVNFDNFFNAFEAIFIVIVGDDWQNILYDAIRTEGYAISVIYFFILIVIGKFFLLNVQLTMMLKGFIKNLQHLERKKKFKRLKTMIKPGFQEGRSLYIFGPQNPLRILMVRLLQWKYFDSIVLLLITISSILLAIDNPLNDPEGDLTRNLYYCDIIMTIFFTWEMMIKVIAKGFVANGEESYMLNGWNILDFGIVMVSIVSLIIGGSSLGFLKALRTLRVVRPLRLISRNTNLKVVINSLIRSFTSIATVTLVALFFLTLIGIMTISFFKGSFFYWEMEHLDAQLRGLEIITKKDCLNYGGAWINQDSNFDNLPQALLTLTIIMTSEGWTQISHNGVDAVGIDKNPQLNQNFAWAYFFIIFVIFGTFILINMTVLVVVDNYNLERTREEGTEFLTDAQMQYVNMKGYMLNSRPLVKTYDPKNWFRSLWYKWVQHPSFEWIIIIAIILNSIVIALRWYDQSEEEIFVIENINLAFTIIFATEAAMKIMALGRSYFKESWNKFDLFIVIFSLIEIALNEIYGFDLPIISLFRIFRIGRVLRIMKSASNLRVAFTTFILTLPAVANIGALILLFLYIYTILGVQLFAKVKVNGVLNNYANFQEFWKAFMLLMRSMSGEAWNEIMYALAFQDGVLIDCVVDPTYEEIQANGGEPNGCGTPVSYAFFVSFILIVSLIFLNIFIAATIQSFEDSVSLEKGMLTGAHYESFRICWAEFDPNGTGTVEASSLSNLLGSLEPPLGFQGKPRLERHFMKAMADAELTIIDDSKVHFWEVANALMQKVYKEKHNGTSFETDAKIFANLQKKLDTRAVIGNKTLDEIKSELWAVLLLQAKIRRWLEKARAKIKLSPQKTFGSSEQRFKAFNKQRLGAFITVDTVKEDDDLDEEQSTPDSEARLAEEQNSKQCAPLQSQNSVWEMEDLDHEEEKVQEDASHSDYFAHAPRIRQNSERSAFHEESEDELILQDLDEVQEQSNDSGEYQQIPVFDAQPSNKAKIVPIVSVEDFDIS